MLWKLFIVFQTSFFRVNLMPQIPLAQIDAHPDNANRMPEPLLVKLERHIRESGGKYPPLIVRPHPTQSDRYQLLDGHHRAQVLRRLGYETAACEVWEVDDQQATLLLLTLNRLQGEDDPQRRGKLMAKLADSLGMTTLAALLPDDADRIRRLMATTQPPPMPAHAPLITDMPQAVTFFLTQSQRSRLLKRLDAVAHDRSAALVQLLGLGSDDACSSA